MHHRGGRVPRPKRRHPRARRGRLGRQSGRSRQSQEVPREVRAPIHAPRRRGPCGRRDLRRLGREAELRPHLHGTDPLDLPDRSRRARRQGLAEGQGAGPRRGRAQGARRAPGDARLVTESAQGNDGPVAHTWRPARFMVIAAHPDDADFGPAATAALWIDAGSEGWLVCCTSGDQGGEGPDIDPLELGAVRARGRAGAGEGGRRGAADVVGYAGVTFLHAPDGALANDLALREQLVREIRTFRPDAVFATDPESLFHGGRGVNHTDHRAAGMAAIDAVYPAARNPMAFPWLARAGLAAHRVRRLYLFWSDKADTWIDVSDTIDRKVDALRAHASQITDPDGLAERIRTRAAEAGAEIRVAAADALRLIVIDDDDELDEAEEEDESVG